MLHMNDKLSFPRVDSNPTPPNNQQLKGKISTQHMFIIVIIHQHIFQMKLKTQEEILVLHFGVYI
jgi:hypothetical protein